jgi:hypothetical protein
MLPNRDDDGLPVMDFDFDDPADEDSAGGVLVTALIVSAIAIAICVGAWLFWPTTGADCGRQESVCIGPRV